jgi:hypothetical protein
MVEWGQVELTHGFVASFSLADMEIIMQRQWRIKRSRRHGLTYAVGTVKKKQVAMHRLILPGDHHVDHRDGNGLNNRRENLRACTHAMNMANRGISKGNTTGFKGVVRCGKRFGAQIKKNRAHTWLGVFSDPAEAARAYDRAALELFGDFARLNFERKSN